MIFKDRVKLKTGVMATENSQYSQFTISQYYCFTVFLLNKCSLAERKRHFKKHLKNLTDAKLLNGKLFILGSIY